MKRAWLALGLLALAARLGAEGARPEMEALLGAARASLELRLGRFDDPALQQAVLQALSRGAKVRLIAGAEEKALRRAAPALRQAGLELRWALKGQARFVVADSSRLLLGSFDGAAEALSSGACAGLLEDPGLAAEFRDAFEKEWAGLSGELPQKLQLEDQLEALPDPRESEPHLRVKRRK